MYRLFSALAWWFKLNVGHLNDTDVIRLLERKELNFDLYCRVVQYVLHEFSEVHAAVVHTHPDLSAKEAANTYILDRLLALAEKSRRYLEVLLGVPGIRPSRVHPSFRNNEGETNVFSDLGRNWFTTMEVAVRLLHHPQCDDWVAALIFSHQYSMGAVNDELLEAATECGFYTGAAWMLTEQNRWSTTWCSRAKLLLICVAELKQYPAELNTLTAVAVTTRLADGWTLSRSDLHDTVAGILSAAA